MILNVSPELRETAASVQADDAESTRRLDELMHARKLCPCGKMFTPYRPYQRYCCDAHRVKYGKSGKSSYHRRPVVERQCKNPGCRKLFKTNDSKRHYCSDACYAAVQAARRARLEERTCMNPACGKTFMTTHWSKRYCCKACREAARRS